MPSENKTPNIGLNQWESNEYIKRQDFVEDNALIDAAIQAAREEIHSVDERKADLENGKVPVLQLPRMDYLDPDGDGKNVSVTFTESGTRVNILTGEKLTVLFGKIKKYFTDLKTIAFTGSYLDLSDKPTSLPANGGIATTLTGLLSSISELNFVKGVTSAIQTQLNGKAPTSHAAGGSTYGLGTNAVYGHVALSDSLNSTSGQTAGIAATPAAVKAINDRLILKEQRTVIQRTTSGNWTVPASVYFIDVVLVGGGGGGGYGAYGGGGAGGGGGGSITIIPNIKVTPGQVIPVVIGAGGLGGTTNEERGGTGGTSVFLSNITATGGTGGYRTNSSSGGSWSQPGGSGTSTTGNNGGTGGFTATSNANATAGSNGITSSGFIGVISSILGAGGGGGGASGSSAKPTGSVGGQGLFGSGAGGRGQNNDGTLATNGSNAVANSGGGGGGGGSSNAGQSGGNGGSGVCIITY